MSDPNSPHDPAASPGPVPRPEPVPERGAHEGAAGEAPSAAVRADLTKRFLAFLIDAVIAAILSRVPWLGPFLAALYILFRDGFDVEFMDHRSIGKRILRLRPLRDDGAPLTLQASAARNWPLVVTALPLVLWLVPVLGWVLIPLAWVAGLVLLLVEAILTVTDDAGRRWGDRLAGTRVVETES